MLGMLAVDRVPLKQLNPQPPDKLLRPPSAPPQIMYSPYNSYDQYEVASEWPCPPQRPVCRTPASQARTPAHIQPPPSTLTPQPTRAPRAVPLSRAADCMEALEREVYGPRALFQGFRVPALSRFVAGVRRRRRRAPKRLHANTSKPTRAPRACAHQLFCLCAVERAWRLCGPAMLSAPAAHRAPPCKPPPGRPPCAIQHRPPPRRLACTSPKAPRRSPCRAPAVHKPCILTLPPPRCCRRRGVLPVAVQRRPRRLHKPGGPRVVCHRPPQQRVPGRHLVPQAAPHLPRPPALVRARESGGGNGVQGAAGSFVPAGGCSRGWVRACEGARACRA